MDHYSWYHEQEREKDSSRIRRETFAKGEELHKSLALRGEQLQTQRDQAASSTNKLMTRLTVLALLLATAQVLTLSRHSLIAKAAVWLWHLFLGAF